MLKRRSNNYALERVSRHGCKVLYSDRMIDWDRDLYNECCEKVWNNHKHNFDGRKIEEIEKFLRLYLGTPVKVYGVITEINAFNGYPYWAFYYDEIKKGVVA